jgi:hypothetical protein
MMAREPEDDDLMAMVREAAAKLGGDFQVIDFADLGQLPPEARKAGHLLAAAMGAAEFVTSFDELGSYHLARTIYERADRLGGLLRHDLAPGQPHSRCAGQARSGGEARVLADQAGGAAGLTSVTIEIDRAAEALAADSDATELYDAAAVGARRDLWSPSLAQLLALTRRRRGVEKDETARMIGKHAGPPR